MRTDTRFPRVFLLLTFLAFPACDDGGDGDSSTGATDASDTGDTAATSADTGGETNVCTDPTMSTAMCGADCTFDPATVDCMNACQNIATQCASDACSASDECVGQNQDVALCAVACEGTKSLACTNIIMGCWDTAGGTANCEDVGTCVNMNL